MTRLSDSLRGLADRAPVDEVGVSTLAATRRIHRGRRWRAAANATAGVGVAAVIALAAINPGINSGNSNSVAAAMPEAAADNKMVAPGFDASGASQLAWGQCGTQPFNGDAPAVSDARSLTLEEVGTDVELGATVTASLVVTQTGDTPATGYESTGTTFIVLWNGIVVATTQNPGADPAVQSSADGAVSFDSPVDLVNCWDGTALPAGAYELVAYQELYAVAAPAVEPTLAPVEPTLAPVEPSIVRVAPAPSSDERAVSNTVQFVVKGEVPEDPFGAYLSPAVPAIVYPDDYLTPAAARDEYAARTTTDVWDMAAGTQRVVKLGDQLSQGDENAWLESYYGCSNDGVTPALFPATSADWPLLNVNATIPGSVGVSYGWVVDGNPEVKVSVTNISGHTLPGFWGQPSNSLYLVKDGKVVAVSYLAWPDPNGYISPNSANGLLSPEEATSGTYLWRDVNACWILNSEAKVKPGTYTVLTQQDIYLDNGQPGYGGPMVYVDGPHPTDGGPAVKGANADVSKAIAPAPVDENYDWVSLQVWTSLGQVTVT